MFIHPFQAVEHLHKSNGHAPNYKFRFLNYAQSNNCQSMSDSSVSYAAGALYQKWILPFFLNKPICPKM